MGQCKKVANLYIATLKAIALVSQHSHWKSSGDDFYGNHLMLERIYETTLESLDLMAEKFIGILGMDFLSYQLQNELLNKVLFKYSQLENKPVEMTLAIEKDFIKLSNSVYDTFKNENKLTLGLDDALMSISSSAEEAAYLLQQTLQK